LKRFERQAFVLLFIATLSCGAIGLYVLLLGGITAGKWIASAGLFATVTGVVQLEVGGLFQKIMEIYGDEEKYPYGPPSHITRQIIDNPDRPFATWVRNTCFFNVRTGFWLIVVGTLVQVLAVWV
jgi:hypothetical protein